MLTTIVAVVSDMHTGSVVGIMPRAWQAYDGHVIQQNPLQEILYAQWLECWEAVRQLCNANPDAKLIVVNAGDPVDGDHHETTELTTQRIDEQERMHVALMQEALKTVHFDHVADELYYIAGTPAHGGIGATSEERIVRALLGDIASGGTRALRVLRRRVNGVLFEVAHQGARPGRTRLTKGNGLRNYLNNEYITRLERQEELPRWLLFGHYHTFEHAYIERYDGVSMIDGFLLPCFSFKSDYIQSLAPNAYADIGMWIGVIDDQHATSWHCELLSTRQETIIGDVN